MNFEAHICMNEIDVDCHQHMLSYIEYPYNVAGSSGNGLLRRLVGMMNMFP